MNSVGSPGSSCFASLEEAWGPLTVPNLPENPYKTSAVQRHMLERQRDAADVIVPRQPDILDASSVKSYLAHLYETSGAAAVRALVPFLPSGEQEDDEEEEVDEEHMLLLGMLLGLAFLWISTKK